MSKLVLVDRPAFGRRTYVGGYRVLRPLFGFGATLATRGSYALAAVDAATIGRVREIKRALRTLGQAVGGSEVLWTMLGDTDDWEEAACDEFAAFVSRTGTKYQCFPGPYYQVDGDVLWPTMNGLLALDAEYRRVTSGVGSWFGSLLSDCATLRAAPEGMPLFEAFLTGRSHPNEKVDVALDGVGVVPVLAPTPAASWGVRVSPDSSSYPAYQAAVGAMQTMWQSLAQATGESESERASRLAALAAGRAARDRTAVPIGGQPPQPTPGGQTTVEHPCPTGTSWDEPSQQCVCPVPLVWNVATRTCGCPVGTQIDPTTSTCAPPLPPSIWAGLGLEKIPTWAWIGAAGLGVAVLAAKQKHGKAPPKRKRRRHSYHQEY
jgi:hypothetical protein